VVQNELLKNPEYAENDKSSEVAVATHEDADNKAQNVTDVQVDQEAVFAQKTQQIQGEYRTFFNNEVVASIGNISDLVGTMQEVVEDLQNVSDSILQTA